MSVLATLCISNQLTESSIKVTRICTHLAGLATAHAVLGLELRVVLLEVLLDLLLLFLREQRGGPRPPVELREALLHHPEDKSAYYDVSKQHKNKSNKNYYFSTTLFRSATKV